MEVVSRRNDSFFSVLVRVLHRCLGTVGLTDAKTVRITVVVYPTMLTSALLFNSLFQRRTLINVAIMLST